MVTARAYPRPSPKAQVGPAVWWWRYQRAWLTHGREHPATQAAFGRYIAAKGHVMQDERDHLRVGPAFVAWMRASANAPGYRNRRIRRAQTIRLDAESWKRVNDDLAKPRPPNQALRDLMKGQS